MRSRKVEFSGARGEKLTGLLDLPEDERPVACALFAHCFTCG
ncbi:MAG: alpha/beta hydrolase, partial [Deltaproteobacteria bacterium]